MRRKRLSNKQSPRGNQQPWWLLVLVLPWSESPTINISLENHEEVHSHQYMQALPKIIKQSELPETVPVN